MVTNAAGEPTVDWFIEALHPLTITVLLILQQKIELTVFNNNYIID